VSLTVGYQFDLATSQFLVPDLMAVVPNLIYELINHRNDFGKAAGRHIPCLLNHHFLVLVLPEGVQRVTKPDEVFRLQL
jgi:hypothetical protein